MSLCRWATLALLICAVNAQAQDAPVPATLTQSTEVTTPVTELVRRAGENNPRILAARFNLQAARGRHKALTGLANPSLLLVPGIGGNQNSRDEEITVSQPVDLFGQRRANANVLAAEVRQAEADLLQAQRTLIAEVKRESAQLFAAQESEKLAATQVEIATSFLSAARRRAELGDVPPVQAERAELELLRAQNDLETATAERTARRATVNALAGASPETPLIVTSPLPVSETTAPEKAELLKNALASRPDLLSAQAQAEANRAQVKVFQRQMLPTLELQARHAPFFRDGNATSFRAVFSMPLFDFGSNKSQRRAAAAEAEAQVARVEWLRRQTATQLETAIVRLEQARRRAVRYQDSIVPRASDLLRKTRIGYETGASTYLEVLEAQRSLRQVQTEYLQSLAAVSTEEAALEAASGTDLPVEKEVAP